MSENPKSNIRGAAYALLAFALFSTHDVGVKMLGGTYSPFQIIFFSVLFGFPLATLMLMRDPAEGNLRPVHPWWTALRTGAAVVTGFSAFYAFSVLPLAQVYAVLFATPLIITVLSIPVLGEKVGIHRWFAVALGLAGVIVVLRPSGSDLTLGHLAAIMAAVGSATASVVVRKIGKEERSAVLMLYPMVANFAVMACILPVVYQPMPMADLAMTGLISALAFVAALCVIMAYRSGDAAVVAPMQYSQMLWAALYGALFFAERIDAITWAGVGLIVASGLYILLREARAGISINTPVLRTRTRYESGTFPRISALQGKRNGHH